MLLTQTELNKLLDQVNDAFKDQKLKLEMLQNRIDLMEAKLSEEERPKTRTRRSKRVQQTQENAQTPNEEVFGGSQEG